MQDPRGAGASRSSDDLHNEDAYLVDDEIGLYAVCDGRGDAPGGEVAAYLAVEGISRFLGDLLQVDARDRERGPAAASLVAPVSCRTIESAVQHALQTIVENVAERPDLAGMASTLTLLLIQRGRAFVGHVGDSRAYLVRRDRAVQLTTDHEWTTSEHPTRGAGHPGIDTFSIETRSGDTFVLCTDGAEQAVSDPDWIESMADSSPRLVASRLASAAHRHRPEEDATVVVVRIRDDHAFARVGTNDLRGRDAFERARIHAATGRPQRPSPPFEHLMERSVGSAGQAGGRRSEPV